MQSSDALSTKHWAFDEAYECVDVVFVVCFQEYITHLREDLCDVTSSDMQIFPSAPADDTAGILPTHNLGERMLGWMDHMLRTKIVRKDVLKIVDFTDTNSVLTFASDSCMSPRHPVSHILTHALPAYMAFPPAIQTSSPRRYIRTFVNGGVW